MGLEKTTYNIPAGKDINDDSSASSDFCRYNISEHIEDASPFTVYYGGYGEAEYFIRNTGYGTIYQIGTVRLRIKTDGAGVATLKATMAEAVFEGTLQYCLTTSRTVPASGWKTVGSNINQSNYTVTVSNAKLLPNTVYYFWLSGVSTGNIANANCRLLAPVTFTTSGTYGAPGDISANNANFGSAVSMSYASATSGATYTVKVSVPTTSGTANVVTLQTQNSTSSRSWTPAVATYAPLITDRKRVTATITVQTYFSGTLSGTKTKTITLTFTSATVGPSLASGAFSIAARNTGDVAGLAGYIQGYSKIRATMTTNKITLAYGASISKWAVKFGSAAAVNVDASTTYKDSAVISATTSVVCTLTDSRGFTASQTLTATIIPYQDPTFTCKVRRSNSSGTLADDGTYMRVDFNATIAQLKNGSTVQNTLTVQYYYKRATASSYSSAQTISPGTPTESGTNQTYTVSNYKFSGYQDYVYDIKVIATDALGNSVTKTFKIQSAVWALHIRNGGDGAAIGKAAENANRMQIPDGWRYYRGTYKVWDAGDITPVSKSGDTMTGTLYINPGGIAYEILKNTGYTVGTAPTDNTTTAAIYFRGSTDSNMGHVSHMYTAGRSSQMRIGAANWTNGTGSSTANNLVLSVSNAGVRAVTVSEAAPWVNALLTPETVSPTVPSSLPSGVNSVTIIGAVRSGFAVSVTFTVSRNTTAITSWATIATGLPEPAYNVELDGHMPKGSTTGAADRALYCRVSTGGALQVAYGTSTSGNLSYTVTMTYIANSL